MKYKIGDKVRIVGNNHNHYFNVGSLVEITGLDEIDCDYKCSGIDKYGNKDSWWVSEDDIAPLEYTWEDFLKAPIGTKVTFEKGEVYVKDTEESFNFNRDFLYYDEVEKFASNDFGKIVTIEEPIYTTVYEPKEEVKEMTIAELEKELGYKIKVVKEK